ncbi:MAG TPA: AmmeMemoRadiSam system protein B [Verrucomicrobiae bacterium]|nr:AmmeMemoRadiSam system protein B [Verrucomicrobiae bacterium]
MDTKRTLSFIALTSFVIGITALAIVIVAQAPNRTQGRLITGIVVPHHDIVKEKRAQLFAEIHKRGVSPATVILVSPNHYNSGVGVVQASTRTWTLNEGEIAPNMQVINRLLQAGVREESESFTNEHGVRLVLSDIEKNFPDASIVPLIVKEGATESQINQVFTALVETCENCLLVASVDFSHYQPAILANLHDSLTRRLLQNGDKEAVLSKAEVDCGVCLSLLIRWSDHFGAKRFSEFAHTNSGELIADPDIETTTHIFGWYEMGERTVPQKSVSFLMGGDAMFDRGVASLYPGKDLKNVFATLGPRTFWGTDLSLLNLEGPISATPVVPAPADSFSFHFPPETVSALDFAHVNAVSLANNHTFNQGAEGLSATRDLLDKAGIQQVGGPSDVDTVRTITIKGEGLNLHVVSVHAITAAPDLTPLIKRLKGNPADRVLVFPHWGIEYEANHSPMQAALAHAWMDAGADMVVGSHPHVVQDTELYNGKPIFYSLGNFVFDQEFSAETQQGLVLAGEFTENGVTIFALPTQGKDLQPGFTRSARKAAILEELYQPFLGFTRETKAGVLLQLPLR